MSNMNSQTQSLSNLIGVQDLPNEVAAAIQGGASMELYETPDKKNRLGSFNFGRVPRLSENADNKISSIAISEGEWIFYKDPDFKGASLRLPKADYWTLKGAKFNDGTSADNAISSFEKA
jgi:Beta/Gamma crystallin